MGKYDKAAETKIRKIIEESAHNNMLVSDKQRAIRPKATALSRREGHLMLAEMQGE